MLTATFPLSIPTPLQEDSAAWPRAAAVMLVVLAGWSVPALAADVAPDKRVEAAQPKTKGASSVLAVETVQLRQTTMNRSLSASGSVAAYQEASVSPKIGGLRIARIAAQVGSRVKRGDLMLEFDDDTMRAELAQMEANVAEAEAAHADARRGAERARKVGESGAMATHQVEQLLTAENTTKARLAALVEGVKLQQLRLKQANLLAPDDGIVSQRAATLGAVVPAGVELFRIIRGGRLEWRAEVPAGQMARLAPGTSARITLEDGSHLQGTVRMVSPTVDPVTRLGIAHVDLPAASTLRPGMFVRGDVLLGDGQASVLPESAVMLRDGFHMVAKLGVDQRVSFVKVGVGKRQGASIEIVDGLPADSTVVARGGAMLGEGDKVRVVGATP